MRQFPLLQKSGYPPSLHLEDFDTCIESTSIAARLCVMCADTCAQEENARELFRCIRVCQDTADICAATVRILSRKLDPDWSLVRKQIQMCATAVAVCAGLCGQFAPRLPYCGECASACSVCHQSCNLLMESLPISAYRGYGESAERPEYTPPREL